jgi:OOP family OmpA-OmpF porin
MYKKNKMKKEKSMKRILITLSSIVALSVSSYAGGKYVEPEDAPVEVIPAVINPSAFYVGLGVVAAGLSRDCPCANSDRLKDTTYGALVRVGWDFNQYIGVEARYLNASMEDDFSQTTHYGIYAKPQYHITNQMNIYGLVGYGKTTVDYDNKRGRTSTLDKTGLSYGVGFEYALGTHWDLWLDYQHLLNDEGKFNTDSNVLSLGVRYNF